MIRTSGHQARGLVEARLAAFARRVPRLRPRMMRQFTADLQILHDALERTELNGRYWVGGGLLLGWAREGAILEHDTLDADFAVADEDFQYLLDSIPAILQAGFRRDRCFVNNAGQLTELTFLRHGARFEFFRMFLDNDRRRYFNYCAGDFEAIEVEKSVPEQALVTFPFLGRSWLKHADHELELRWKYGSWEVPDLAWSYLDGPNVQARRTWYRTDFDWRDDVRIASHFSPRSHTEDTAVVSAGEGRLAIPGSVRPPA